MWECRAIILPHHSVKIIWSDCVRQTKTECNDFMNFSFLILNLYFAQCFFVIRVAPLLLAQRWNNNAPSLCVCMFYRERYCNRDKLKSV